MAPANQAIKVIIVGQDDDAIRLLFQQTLHTLGFEVALFEFGTRDFRLNGGEYPDAIIFLLNVIDNSVFDLLKLLKADDQTASIPALATTVHWRDYDEDFFTSLGFSGIIKQPLDFPTLASTIQSFIKPL